MKWIVGILLLGLCFKVTGQVSVASFLGAPITDEEFLYIEAKKDFLDDHKFNSPWLREIDFRLRTTDVVSEFDEYRLRLGLINPLEIKANKAYRNLINEQMAFERAEVLNNVFKFRYELLLEYRTLLGQRSYLETLQNQYKQLNSLMIQEGTDIGDLLDIKEFSLNIALTLEQCQQKLSVVKNAIIEIAGADLAMDQIRWVTTTQISSELKTNKQDSTYLSIKERNELALEEQLLKIDKAEAYSNLGFVQAEYDIGRGTSLDQKIGFQFGVNIPIVNRDKPDIQREELSMIEERVAAENAEKANDDAEKNQVKELNSSLKKQEIVKKFLGELSTIEKLIKEESASFKTLHQFFAYKHKLLNKERDIHQNILNQYISWLHFTMKLSAEPYQNHLSESKDIFELVD